MLAQGDEGGRATVRNARIPRCLQAVSCKLATSLELVCFMGDSAAEYTQ